MDDEPWVTMVQNPDSVVVHGLDPRRPEWTLCGAVEVTMSNKYRAPFYGSESRACSMCAELLPNNHY